MSKQLHEAKPHRARLRTAEWAVDKAQKKLEARQKALDEAKEKLRCAQEDADEKQKAYDAAAADLEQAKATRTLELQRGLEEEGAATDAGTKEAGGGAKGAFDLLLQEAHAKWVPNANSELAGALDNAFRLLRTVIGGQAPPPPSNAQLSQQLQPHQPPPTDPPQETPQGGPQQQQQPTQQLQHQAGQGGASKPTLENTGGSESEELVMENVDGETSGGETDVEAMQVERQQDETDAAYSRRVLHAHKAAKKEAKRRKKEAAAATSGKTGGKPAGSSAAKPVLRDSKKK